MTGTKNAVTVEKGHRRLTIAYALCQQEAVDTALDQFRDLFVEDGEYIDSGEEFDEGNVSTEVAPVEESEVVDLTV